MSTVLLAFDVDGTLDTSAGPVPWHKVRGLHGVALGIVSPSGARPADETPTYLAPEGRAESLQLFALAHPSAKLRLYVSDNNDGDAAHAAGFCLVTPAEFARGLA